MDQYNKTTFFIFLLLILTRPITVFLHELGHALVAWFITGKKIFVFIGSFGNKDKSIRIHLKSFEFYFYKNPFKWGHGLCVTEEKTISITNQIWYVLAGPSMSLLVSGISYLIIAKTNLWELFFTSLLISSLIDFLISIIPSTKSIKLSDGRTTTNDGKKIIHLFKLKKLPKEYFNGLELYNEKKYHDAFEIFENLLIKSKDPNVYRMAIYSSIQSKDFIKAKEISEKFRNNHKLNSDDFSNIGLTYTNTGELQESLELYKESLKLNPNNKFALNNIGHTLILLEQYENSIPYFDKAIMIDKDFSYSYNNRGLAKIKIKDFENGLEDIEHSLKLDPENADGFKNLGIYNLEKGNFEKALELFLKTKEMDKTIDLIDELIEKAKSKI